MKRPQTPPAGSGHIALAMMLAAVILLVPSSSLAQISVDRVILHFAAGQRPVQNVVVSNSGDDALGIEVIPQVVVNPGSREEKRETTSALIVSPKRFSISGGGQRTIRLLLREVPKDMEAVYRVKLLPKPKGFDEQSKGTDNKKTMLRVVTTVGLLIFAQPPGARTALRWERKGEQLIFTNDGNTNVFLDNGKACRNDTDCQDLPANRVYAGNSWTVRAPGDREVVFTKHTAGGFENIQIPPS